MAVRYRVRQSGEGNEWGRARRLRRLMWLVRRRQRRFGQPFRERRREKQWRAWIARPRHFRQVFRRHLKEGDIGVFQFQVGGANGPVFGVLKFHQAPRTLPIGERVIENAKTCIGIPYGFGEANGPEDPGKDELDCSGLTQYDWGCEGVFLPHSAEMQHMASNVDLFHLEAQCQPGDLVLMNFPNSRGIEWPRASHVGHWLRPGWMIDTRSPQRPVDIRPIERDRVVAFGRPRASQQR